MSGKNKDIHHLEAMQQPMDEIITLLHQNRGQLENLQADLFRLKEQERARTVLRKRNMLIIQVSVLMLYLIVITIGVFYGLYENHGTYRYVSLFALLFLFVVFMQRNRDKYLNLGQFDHGVEALNMANERMMANFDAIKSSQED